MIILGAAGLLLLTYNGYSKVDKVVCGIAGLLALLVCLFPCGETTLKYVGTFNVSVDISSIIHNCSAIAFFTALSINSLFLFTKTSGVMTDKKRKRNIIYIVCGLGMILSFVLLIPFNLLNISCGI